MVEKKKKLKKRRGINKTEWWWWWDELAEEEKDFILREETRTIKWIEKTLVYWLKNKEEDIFRQETTEKK